MYLPVQPGGKFPTYTVELYGEACLAISSIDSCFVALNEEKLKLYLQKVVSIYLDREYNFTSLS